jgi:hypothetical protein
MRSRLLNLSDSRTKRPQLVEPSVQDLVDLSVINLPIHVNERVSPAGACPAGPRGGLGMALLKEVR